MGIAGGLVRLGVGPAGDALDDYGAFDTFTDVINTSLDAHTPERCVSGWVEHNGDWKITPGPLGSNGAGLNAAVSYGVATLDSGLADGRLRVWVTELMTNKTVNRGPRLRHKTATKEGWFVIAKAGGLQLQEHDGASWTTNYTARAGAALPAGQDDYWVRVVLDGQTITCYADGVSCSYNAAARCETETRHGIQGSRGANWSAFFDDFSVRRP
jgi:hypothetical protein